jgi:opacity protein-like surface antigen
MNQSKGKEMKRLAVAAASVLLMLGTAQAQSRAPLYGELGYSFLEFKSDDGGFKVKPHALRGIVGYEFHPNVAAEGMLAFGTRSDDVSDGVSSVDIKLRHAFGVFVKPKYNFGPAEVFARIGYARIKVKATECVTGLGCASFSDSDGDVAWGFGANYNINPRMYVGADWMRLNDDDGGKVQGITINFGYRF